MCLCVARLYHCMSLGHTAVALSNCMEPVRRVRSGRYGLRDDLASKSAVRLHLLAYAQNQHPF